MRLYAHRGSPGTTSYENTVPAVAACLAGGADGVEVDLRLSVDGVLVVCHDPDLRRMAGAALDVARTTWPQLRAAAALGGVPLARAEQLLATAAGSRVVLELKQPPPGRTPATAAALVALLVERHDSGLAPEVTVSSFAPPLVAAVRELAPGWLGLRTALLGRETERPSAVLRRALDAGHDEVHPHVRALLAEPGVIDQAHALGAAVVPWTVNRSRDVRRLAALGVDAMITDVPVSARAALAVRRTRA